MSAATRTYRPMFGDTPGRAAMAARLRGNDNESENWTHGRTHPAHRR